MKRKGNDEKVKKPLYKKWWFIGLVVIIVIGIIGSGGEDTSSEVPQESISAVGEELEVEIEGIVDYEVFEKEDVSYNNVNRYNWEVVVHEPANIEQIRAIAIEIIEEAKKDKDFNAIVIFFYDYPEFIGNGFTLGKVEYAPDGDFAKADTVKTGQYNKMDYKFQLREKDWSKQLSKEEVEIFNARNELYYSQVSPTDLPNESEIDNEIAQQFNIQEDEINRIMMKQAIWMMDDIL